MSSPSPGWLGSQDDFLNTASPNSFDGEGVGSYDAQPQAPYIPHIDDDDLSYEGSDNTASLPENGNDNDEIPVNKEVELHYDSTSSSDEFSREPNRPNKYHGPASTWRTWTRQERMETDALETIQAKDLSIHLFNAFALRRKASEVRRKQISRNASGTERFKAKDADNLPLFVPSKAWAAWPMPSNIVPRPDERVTQDEDDGWNMRMPPDSCPSAELEECLIAQMLKTSKERFAARQWDRRTPGDGEVKDENDSTDDGHSVVNLRPMVQTDDDKSRRVLHPAARHILTKFDELLLNLHEARKAYVNMADTPGLDEETEAEFSSKSPSSGRTKRKSKNDLHKSGGRKRPRSKSVSNALGSDIEMSEEADESVGTPAISRSTSRNPETKGGKSRTRTKKLQYKRQERLGLRDWSDIVGIASMTGWNTSAVSRTARRCADLFGEDMEFRTMGEGKLHLDKTNEGTAHWNYAETEDSGGEDEAVEFTGTQPIATQADKTKQYAEVCPVKECSRHKKGFSRKWNLNQHLKNRHPDLVAGRVDVESSTAGKDT